MKLTVTFKLKLWNNLTKQRIRSAGGSLDCRLNESMAVGTVGQKREYEAHGRNNTLAQDKGNADYLSTRGAMGNRWKHIGNQGRQSDT